MIRVLVKTGLIDDAFRMPAERESRRRDRSFAGVGRATVREFARYGARLGLLARGREGLHGACREAEALGAQAIIVPTDVAYPDQVDAAATKIEDTLGPIDVWVNNAMASVLSPVKDMLPTEYQRVTDVTYLGYVYGTLAALKRMLPPGSRDYYSSRIGIGLSVNSAAVGVLRSETCHQRFYRIVAIGIASRWQSRPCDEHPAPRGQHAAVFLDQNTYAEASAAGAPYLPAGGHRPGHCVGGSPSTTRSVRGMVGVQSHSRRKIHTRTSRSLSRPNRL